MGPNNPFKLRHIVSMSRELLHKEIYQSCCKAWSAAMF